jgi:hypothetical protein
VQYFPSQTSAQLEETSEGYDRGVAIPFAGSNGENHDFSEIHRKRMDRAERRRKRYQKKCAKLKKDSHQRRKTKEKISDCYASVKNIKARIRPPNEQRSGQFRHPNIRFRGSSDREQGHP